MRMVKQMGESLTPWDYQSQPADRQYLLKRGSLANKTRINRYNSEGYKIRAATSQKSRSGTRQVIKLQQRVPTEMFNIADWQVQMNPLGLYRNQLFIKIPNQFVTLPPKKQSNIRNKSSKSLPRYQQNMQFNRQNIAFRNFKKEIEDLDRLKAGSKFDLQLKSRSKIKTLVKISQTHPNTSFVKSFKPAFKNMNIFDDPKPQRQQKSQRQSRVSKKQPKNTHILDTLLSKFQ